jgi:hypothetical protein
MRRLWEQFKLDWEMGLHRLPFFTQRTAVALLGVLVATLALLGGLATIVRPPDRQSGGAPGELGGPTTTAAVPATGGGSPGAGQPGAGGPAAAELGGAGAAPAAPAAPGRGTPGSPVAAPVTTSPGGGGAAPATTRAAAPAPTTTTTTGGGGGGGLPPVTVTVTITLPLPHLDVRASTGPAGHG